jgi:hypothetical protein
MYPEMIARAAALLRHCQLKEPLNKPVTGEG